MPVLFVGHGSPMNAIEENGFSRAWARIGRSLPRPVAILCVSAHWETAGTRVTAMPRPRTIHDFLGFPRPLYEVLYPAKGSPDLARLVADAVRATPVRLDEEWGLDHGSWSVLRRMYPDADIPVVQLSLDRTKEAAFHYKLGRELKGLRKRGVLIVGSGNMVHNLRRMVPEDVAFDWADEYDSRLQEWILAGDHDSIVDYPRHGEIARLSIPTNEHYLPLLYVLALREEGEPVEFFAEKVTLGSISMRSLRVG
ncbi:MAG: 4,5-DOPA dioxygenase extradiol [Deltaproteobacteria bacterium]|nr:4,5-DOPA dioxygenase extradiol [Deltaproteobacteria bacterium]